MAAVRVFVTDVARAREFYTRALGFEVVEEWGPAIAILRRGDLELWLSGPNTSAAKPWSDGTVPTPGIGFSRPVLRDPGVPLNAQLIVEAGGQIVNGPLTGPGGTQTVIRDPDGNTIEFFEA